MNSNSEDLVVNIQQSFLGLFNDYLSKDLIEKAKGNKSALKIISIACGRFREARCVFEYFSDCKGNIKLHGIDSDNELLELARNEEVIKSNPDKVLLKSGDASKLDNYKEWIMGDLFDLIIVRHPEITFNNKVFIEIFMLCENNLLSKNGYLFITTHFENEREIIKSILKELSLEIITEIENKHAASFKMEDGKISYADKFLLIGHK